MDKEYYEILPAVKVRTRRVTVGSIEVLNEIGMFEDKFINEVKELYLKPMQLQEFILAVFALDDEQKKKLEAEIVENNGRGIILEEMVRGYWDFFGRLQPKNNRLQELLKTSMDMTSKTKTS